MEATMRLCIRSLQPCTVAVPSKRTGFRCCTVTENPTKLSYSFTDNQPNWPGGLRLVDPVDLNTVNLPSPNPTSSVRLGNRWMEYQGIGNWDGLLDPLDDKLRQEILRYGKFVDAAYQSFEFDPSSPSYATCKFPKSSFLDRSGLPDTGYRLTKNLRATSGIQLPRWIERGPSWVATQSSWIGFVAVCQDKNEIARLGRRDVVIAFRGTATCLEWLENLRATLTNLPNCNTNNKTITKEEVGPYGCGPMVESGFLSLYTSGSAISPSLQQMVRSEIARLLQSYGDEPLSLTITGHSLGAALATLAAYDIKTAFKRSPLVTVISFGGPRVGNRSFRCQLEKQGTKVLRIVNSDDPITKVPGFVVDGKKEGGHVSRKREVQMAAGWPRWIRKCVEDTQWVYADVGKELKLSSRDSPHFSGGGFNVATCHELKTYLHLVNDLVSSTCPFRRKAMKMLGKQLTAGA
ncbi:phospholipase A(1) DAD1, chloroplastic-like [Ziziphus jujuba]|uniref:Phospholipase A(1) DAD1, chloroplastic-like n=1 Tax=Ziziphus jujuba TaxID=326968 RepID=A0ABM4AAD2_ZIZJJ|nr:phospholipase A(1) DAD1, chloroplastic-like [Ziziphus jujuba]